MANPNMPFQIMVNFNGEASQMFLISERRHGHQIDNTSIL